MHYYINMQIINSTRRINPRNLSEIYVMLLDPNVFPVSNHCQVDIFKSPFLRFRILLARRDVQAFLSWITIQASGISPVKEPLFFL